MNVTQDSIYISARNATFATYERERDLSLKRKERNEYKEGEFERVRDAQRADYAAAMGRAYAEFQADGIVMVHLVLDKKNSSLLDEPAIFTRGFMVARDGDEVLAGTRKRISEVIQNANGSLQKDVETAVKNYLYNETHRQPTVFVTVSRV